MVSAPILLLSLEWIYGSLHSGWNELHPVRHCQRIGSWAGNWPFNVQNALTDWCGAIDDAHSPTTVGLQGRPENGWRIHPYIDGCDPTVIG